MSYIGSAPQANSSMFAGVYSQAFNGNGSTTTFTLGRYVAQVANIEVIVNNVQQSPFDGSYSIVGGTSLVFSEAPASGTNNIYVVYRDFPVQTLTDTGAVRKTGDTMTGPMVINSAGNDRLQITSGTQSVYLGLDSSGAAIAGGAGQTGPGVYLYNTEGSVNLFTNNTLRLKVDSNGRMTNPYQPAFATTNTNYTQTSNNWSKIIAGLEQFDIGSNYDLANGKFTAPVGGRYIFTFWGLSYPHAAADVSQAQFRKNGVQYGDSIQFGGSSVNHALCSGSIMANLSQNDYFELWFYGATGAKAYAGQWNMCGYLIG